MVAGRRRCGVVHGGCGGGGRVEWQQVGATRLRCSGVCLCWLWTVRVLRVEAATLVKCGRPSRAVSMGRAACVQPRADAAWEVEASPERAVHTPCGNGRRDTWQHRTPAFPTTTTTTSSRARRDLAYLSLSSASCTMSHGKECCGVGPPQGLYRTPVLGRGQRMFEQWTRRMQKRAKCVELQGSAVSQLLTPCTHTLHHHRLYNSHLS